MTVVATEPRPSSRWSSAAFVVSGALLAASSLIGSLWYAIAVLAESGGTIRTLGVAGAAAVGLAWSADAVKPRHATKRWLIVVATITVPVLVEAVSWWSVPVDLELGRSLPFAYTPDDPSEIGRWGFTLLLASTWGALFFAVKVLPFWGALAHHAAEPGVARWWLVVVAAPFWAPLVAAPWVGGTVSAVFSSAVLGWLLWALIRTRRARAMGVTAHAVP